MDSGRELRQRRLQAGLSQRDLAARTGIKQPAIARIESGAVDPRIGTLQVLLEGCGYSLTTFERPGTGVDRTVMRQLLKLTPRERIELAASEAANLAAFTEMVEL